MRTKGLINTLLVSATVMLAAACTSSSGGGVGGSGIVSRGAISEFGSIEVNGTAFDTAQAVVEINGKMVGTGDAAVLAYLNQGRVVTVEGISAKVEEEAAAEKVVYRSDVEGPISAVSDSGPEQKELIVMGQTVMVNTITVLKNVDLEAIVPGSVVEVSGFYDHKGTVWATFMEAKEDAYSEDGVYEVRGVVASHAPRQATFQINGLNVDYASADTGGLPDGKPADGMLVQVVGTVDAAFTLMTAARVAPEDDIEAENSDEVEVTGFVTAKAAAGEFTVGNQVVVVEDGAVFVDGVQADVVKGVKLEAEGELVGGILWAWEIEFWEPDQFEVEGPVTDFVSPSEFTVEGRVVNTTDQTVYEDGVASDIAQGVILEIKGRLQNDVMVADKVSFELEDDG